MMQAFNKSGKSIGLFALSWPIFIEQISGNLSFFFDAFFLSRISDVTAATIGQLQPIILLGFFVIPLFNVAGTSVASQYIGAGQKEAVIPTYMMNLMMCSLLGVVLFLFCFLFSDQIGLWLGMNEEQNDEASRFLKILSFVFLFFSPKLAYSSILATRGLTRWNMYIAILINLVNIFLNFCFVYGPFGIPILGLEGVAFSSVVANIIGLCLAMLMVHKRLKIRFSLQQFTQHRAQVGRSMFKIGLPSLIEPLSYTLQNVFVTIFVISMGFIAMGSITYIHRLLMLEITFCWAIAGGGGILMAYYMGAQDHKKVSEIFWRCQILTVSFAFLNQVLFLIFSQHVISIFTDNHDIHEAVRMMFYIGLIIEPARAVNIITGSALKCVGDAKFSGAISTIFIWGIIPIIYLLGPIWGYGIVGIWLSFAIDEILRAIINLYRWHSGRWKEKGLVKEDKPILTGTLKET